jgi:hypothetical protein
MKTAIGKFEIVDRNLKTFSCTKFAWSRNLRGFFSRISINDHLAYMVYTVVCHLTLHDGTRLLLLLLQPFL